MSRYCRLRCFARIVGRGGRRTSGRCTPHVLRPSAVASRAAPVALLTEARKVGAGLLASSPRCSCCRFCWMTLASVVSHVALPRWSPRGRCVTEGTDGPKRLTSERLRWTSRCLCSLRGVQIRLGDEAPRTARIRRNGRNMLEYKCIAAKRLEYFMTLKPLPQHFTVLVRAIPITDGGSVSDAVDKFFKDYHSSTYLSHTVVHQTGKLRRLLLFNVYSPKYDTGGRFWPIVHNATIFYLVLMHIIAIGVFGLKKLPLASSLLVPLPVLTLLFNEYCRNRFLPIFQAYSTESLIKKDREEQSKPVMAEFFSNLVTAYRDPGLKLIQRSSNSDERTTPLLSSV